MASRNQGRSQHEGPQNGGPRRGESEPRRSTNSPSQEGTDPMADRLREGLDSARDEMNRRYQDAERMMVSNPATSLLVGFGVGFGLGLVITTLLGEREPASWAERNLPSRLRNLPDSVQDSLEQLATSVRNLPDSIAAHLPSSLTRR